MRVGIATDHGGFSLKEELISKLRGVGHEVVDFGAHELTPGDDYPDYVIPLAYEVGGGKPGSGGGDLRQRRRGLRLRQQGFRYSSCADSRSFFGQARGRR